MQMSTQLPHGLVTDLHYDTTDDVLLAGLLGRGAWTLTHPANTSSEEAPESATTQLETIDSATEAPPAGDPLTIPSGEARPPTAVDPVAPAVASPAE